jgi:hypothetical protein
MARAKGSRPWSDVNSIVMDTCYTQQNAGYKIFQHTDLKHLFIIGCDSRGLQLLIKDIIETPKFNQVFKEALEVHFFQLLLLLHLTPRYSYPHLLALGLTLLLLTL